jgi:hypothetical protein
MVKSFLINIGHIGLFFDLGQVLLAKTTMKSFFDPHAFYMDARACSACFMK